jgi:SAM-dependent methyltransferase
LRRFLNCVKRRERNKMPQSSQSESYETITIAEYQTTAESFRDGTWDHDVSQNRDALIAAMPRNPGLILDLGCGPGRDLVAFTEIGQTAIGLDATPAFVEMAKAASGCEVWQQTFLALDLPEAYFDGIFANASLLHVPAQAMERVLKDLWRSLVPGGAIVMSLARGTGEGFVDRPTGARYTSYWEYETIAVILARVGFTIAYHYYRPPNLPPELQSWVAIVARRANAQSGD